MRFFQELLLKEVPSGILQESPAGIRSKTPFEISQVIPCWILLKIPFRILPVVFFYLLVFPKGFFCDPYSDFARFGPIVRSAIVSGTPLT